MPTILKTSFFLKHFSNCSVSRCKIHCSYLSTQACSKPQSVSKSRKASSFLVYCNSQITQNGRNGDIKQAESIFNRMPEKNTISWTAMLTAYAENGQTSKARKLFDEIPQRNIASYNAMITAYIRNKYMVGEAFELFSGMPERNEVSYSAMITGFVKAGMFDKAEKLYCEMPVRWREPVCSNVLINGYLKVGRTEDAVRVFEGMINSNVVSQSCMVDGYCKMGRIIDARNLFDQMLERNVVTWTALIDGYMKMGIFEAGFELFLDMSREGLVKVNSTTMAVLFEACGSFDRYREGIQMHGLVSRKGFDYDVFLGNSVIIMYCRFGCMDEASKVFNMMNKKDVVSWNSLIAGYVQCAETEEAFRLFEVMPAKDIFSWTTMLSGFSCKGMTEKAMELFKMMPEKDDVAWTAVISGFVNNGQYEEALIWFIQMRREEIRINPLTLSSALSASASLASINEGMQIHALSFKMDMEFELSVQNSLVSMYSKCGNTVDANHIFRSITSPNTVSFNSLITGFAQNGFGKEALNLFRSMQNEDCEPNQITFLGVLSACVHVGLVEEGWQYFNSMKLEHNIEPGPDHYACMVDLLGRAGLLHEAVDLIHSMPFEPHTGVWGALLSASRTHLCLDLAQLATRKLIRLEPDDATPYVVLSNLYSTLGKMKDGNQVMMTKKSRGIRKSPGCSWITVKDKVHLFLAGDQSHLDSQAIKGLLSIISMEMGQLHFYR
ncbi:pentatricopeptide repeat-containing protein At1g53600, mitochondrial [Malus sylvestris]|uniref:pentatricopeptide repeat-containing protein At1g53600, mitochondrial n=1 Tax=Malus sylvestris TaxID=3752 RepID=UPI0021ABBC9B|nr:pentatricopeptide repeat-containing protein At1g53600, mitochondrial [Malus sylvestris]